MRAECKIHRVSLGVMNVNHDADYIPVCPTLCVKVPRFSFPGLRPIP